MLLQEAAKVLDLLTTDQVDWYLLAQQIGGDREPGHPCRFHDGLQFRRCGSLTGTSQQVVQIAGPRRDGE